MACNLTYILRIEINRIQNEMLFHLRDLVSYKCTIIFKANDTIANLNE